MRYLPLGAQLIWLGLALVFLYDGSPAAGMSSLVISQIWHAAGWLNNRAIEREQTRVGGVRA